MRGNPYEKCPVIEGKRYLLRLVEPGDAGALLKVYSDEKAVPFFNSDNCHGDDFHYTTLERMEKAIEFWLKSYEGKWFVRWSIVDKEAGEPVGTIELFNRVSEEFYDNAVCGLLRLDLRSDYERREEITEILELLLPEAKELFGYEMEATKAVEAAVERRAALEEMGFERSKDRLRGEDGTEYGGYFVRGDREG